VATAMRVARFRRDSATRARGGGGLTVQIMRALPRCVHPGHRCQAPSEGVPSKSQSEAPPIEAISANAEAGETLSLMVVIGYGPGISHATAERFGRQGYSVALVARNGERVAKGVNQLKSIGIDARGYSADAQDPESIRSAVAKIRREMGPVSALLWTAFRSGDVKDLLATRPESVERVFDIGVMGLLTCVQEALEDLKQSSGSSILVANGALGEASSEADSFAKYLNNDGVALENAAKTKVVGILAERLREFGIYVGEVTIAGSVAGTATASPTAIKASKIAQKFWAMSEQRTSTRVRMAE